MLKKPRIEAIEENGLKEVGRIEVGDFHPVAARVINAEARTEVKTAAISKAADRIRNP
jgi:hypothetical protein